VEALHTYYLIKECALFNNNKNTFLVGKKFKELIFMPFQLVRLNAKGQLGVGERCIEADKQGIKLVFCPLGSVEGPWHYEEVKI